MADEPMQISEEDKSNEWVRLRSEDGYNYLIRRKVATGSGTLKSTLEGNFTESNTGVVPMNDRGIIVEKLSEYLIFKATYGAAKKNEDIPDFQERVDPVISLELLVAADYWEA